MCLKLSPRIGSLRLINTRNPKSDIDSTRDAMSASAVNSRRRTQCIFQRRFHCHIWSSLVEINSKRITIRFGPRQNKVRVPYNADGQTLRCLL